MTESAGVNPSVIENYNAIADCIRETCLRCGRNPHEVRLVAVSKTVGENLIQVLYGANHLEFGENKLQEALPKITSLPDDIIWHFIGRLQQNKVRKILPHFAYIHSVDSLKIAQYINTVAGELDLRPHILLQVNLADEVSKGGFSVEEVESSLGQLLSLPNLDVCGLMAIPPVAPNPEDNRIYFRQLRELRDGLEKTYDCSLPHLSMGMSDDYAVAIEEGATFVRVGSSLFGERLYPA